MHFPVTCYRQDLKTLYIVYQVTYLNFVSAKHCSFCRSVGRTGKSKNGCISTSCTQKNYTEPG